MDININKKIKMILQQPEYIRMRWVWGCVIVSMFVISIFWIFSITSMFANKEKTVSDQGVENNLQDVQEQLQILQKQASEIKNLDSLDASSIESLQENALTPKTAPSEGFSNNPQSADYSTLPKTDSTE
ncbi:MAG TPA: hypothetical protein P5323_00365 [Candidatus Moranbacteria bacterium]|nr:hypothetical protein [Candidatus Moranbacteria bacterium]HRY27577.1 hypothetical protein [Candidatus Moranbacteria bacterium]HSA07806.1 hypothetical protein [Candidatus Moranbacteria bacterium]